MNIVGEMHLTKNIIGRIVKELRQLAGLHRHLRGAA